MVFAFSIEMYHIVQMQVFSTTGSRTSTRSWIIWCKAAQSVTISVGIFLYLIDTFIFINNNINKMNNSDNYNKDSQENYYKIQLQPK